MYLWEALVTERKGPLEFQFQTVGPGTLEVELNWDLKFLMIAGKTWLDTNIFKM